MAARAIRSRTGRFGAEAISGIPGSGPVPTASAPRTSATRPFPVSSDARDATAGCTPDPDRASSVHTRAASMSWSYCTPDGHAVMQAMQPRQRSKCSAAVAVSSAPSRIWFTR